MEKQFGCSIPFYQTTNTNNVTLCQNSTKGAYVMVEFMYSVSPENQIKDCSYPCTNLMIKKTNTRTSDEKGTRELELNFNKFTQVITAKYTYTELELLAEFGGYVGLFLGYSVLNLTDAFNFIVKYFQSFM